MVPVRMFASLILLPLVLGGCSLLRVLGAPDPIDPTRKSMHEQHLEIHRQHHQTAIDAHEAAVRMHQQTTPPPAPVP